MRAHKNGLFLIRLLPTLFEANVKGDAQSQFKNNSAHYWVTTSGEVLPEAALVPLKRHNLAKLKMSLAHDTMFDLLAPLHASGRTSI